MDLPACFECFPEYFVVVNEIVQILMFYNYGDLGDEGGIIQMWKSENQRFLESDGLLRFFIDSDHFGGDTIIKQVNIFVLNKCMQNTSID